VPERAAELFGDLLRQHRLKAGLTQEALAELAGLSVHGIQRLEGGSRQPYRDTVQRLLSALQLSAEDSRALQAVAQPAPRHRARTAPHSSDDVDAHLPTQLTSFIGRESEKDEIVHLLPTARLITLTGVGGCGKTRLALEVAGLVQGQYADGVWLVELASLADPGLVVQAVATTLGIREESNQPLVTALTSTLRHRQTLLILDNCEHLLNACAQLAHALLLACPRLKIIATSREALGIPGEIGRRVSSLPLPPLEVPLTPEALTGYAAARLFVERAQAVQPSFCVTERNAASVAQICNRLDGIPLALELAAALVRGMSVELQVTRLDQRFRLLTGGSRAALPRQQTLRATIDWSYELLTEPERMLFARLSVFAGSWTLEAAEGICTGHGIEPDEVVEHLLHLVDKSLVLTREEPDGADRYWLLDTLRQYGRERLLASGHADTAYKQHAKYYVGLAERIEPELDQPRQSEWITLFARDVDNFRAALEWLIGSGDAQHALRLAAVLARFWEIRAHLREGLQRLAEVLAMPGASAPTLERAKVLDMAGVLALYQFDLDVARLHFKKSLATYRQLRAWRGVAWVLIHLGWLCHDSARLKASVRFLREALLLCEQLGDRRGVARALTLLGNTTFWNWDLVTARSLHERSLALSRELGDRWGIAWALDNLALDLLYVSEAGHTKTPPAEPLLQESYAIWSELGERRHLAYVISSLGECAIRQKDLLRARARLEESLATFAELRDVNGCTATLVRCASLFSAEGQNDHAVVVLSAALAQLRLKLRRLPPWAGPFTELQSSHAREMMDERQFAAAWSRGEAMSMEEASSYAQQHLAATD
jgi:non-specific serine/threonine protein kinase